MIGSFPRTFREIETWASTNGQDPTGSRFRFAQFAVLWAITSVVDLSDALVFKGGNALDLIWSPNRSTRDLDFSVDMSQDLHVSVPTLRALFERALANSERALGQTLRLHAVKDQPPGDDKRFKTYRLNIGYALQDEAKLRERIDKGQQSNHVVPIDISINEPICSDTSVDFGGTRRLRVSNIDDIVAEKLRSLLQQPLRNRARRQDLLDIAVILGSSITIDPKAVSRFLVVKAQARDVPVSKTAFGTDEVKSRAAREYNLLARETRVEFVEFDEALRRLLAFVNQLDIPD